MSMEEGFGKKVNSMKQSFMHLPTITEEEFFNKKHECGGEYIKAETFNSLMKEENGEYYYEMYWKVFCGECFKEYKLLIGKYKLDSKEVK